MQHLPIILCSTTNEQILIFRFCECKDNASCHCNQIKTRIFLFGIQTKVTKRPFSYTVLDHEKMVPPKQNLGTCLPFYYLHCFCLHSALLVNISLIFNRIRSVYTNIFHIHYHQHSIHTVYTRLHIMR